MQSWTAILQSNEEMYEDVKMDQKYMPAWTCNIKSNGIQLVMIVSMTASRQRIRNADVR